MGEKKEKKRNAIQPLCVIGWEETHWKRERERERELKYCVSSTEWARNTERYSAIWDAIQMKRYRDTQWECERVKKKK